MKKQDKINTTYIEYLNNLSSEEINKTLDFYNIKYRKNSKKDIRVNLINENLNSIVDRSLDIFQNDEYINIKYILKRSGLVEVRLNYLLFDRYQLLLLQNFHY